jgi:ABC-type transporter Mla subunit MlaD
MRRALGSFLWISFTVFLHAQAPASPQSGLLPDWDIRVVLEEMSAHAGRLQPKLDQIDAQSWVAKGASDTYQAQLQSSKDQARAIAGGAKALAQNPEKLSSCLELYFRISGLDDMLASLQDGIRRYQDPALAQSLAALAAENGANRNRFQTYIVNLATQREQECAVMDQEAQRCRAVMATQPPPGAGAPRKGDARK